MNRSIAMNRVGMFATCLVALAVVGMSCATANADLLANWTFEVSIPATAGPHAAEGGINAGVGSPATGSHAGTTVYSNPVGNGSAESFSSTAWAVGDYYQFTTSIAGYTNINIAWDQTGSSTGPRDFKVQYSTDGTSFFDIFTSPTYTVLLNGGPNPNWATSGAGLPSAAYSYSRDLSNIPALLFQPTIYLRLVDNSAVAINGSPVAAGGTGRVDNFTINAHPIPLPAAAFVFIGVAGAAGVARRRFKALLS